MPDTGASQTIVSADVARDNRLVIRPTLIELRNASGSVMTLLGEADATLCNDKHSVLSNVLIAAHINHAALVSWQDLQKLHVIPKSFPAVAAAVSVYNDIKTKTIAAFSEVFSDTLDNKPMCAEKMKIYLKQNAVPYRVSAPRPIPLRFQEPANSEIARCVKSGIIIPCDEPTDWCSPAFFVSKGDGKQTIRASTSLSSGLFTLFHQCQT